LGETRSRGCLHVVAQYDGRPLKTERGKGEHARKVPVHPELARALGRWQAEGFEFVHCRKPAADDPILPRTSDGKTHTKSSAYKLWRKLCVAAGVANRSLHAEHAYRIQADFERRAQ
jgi:integrase